MSLIAIKGLRKVYKAISNKKEALKGALSVALYQEGLSIIGASVKQVPVDHGRLRGSHYVAPPKESINGPEVELGYGTDYAVAVHERMDSRHTVGKAKYLQDPMNDAKSGYVSRLAENADHNIRQGKIKVTPSSSVSPKPKT